MPSTPRLTALAWSSTWIRTAAGGVWAPAAVREGAGVATRTGRLAAFAGAPDSAGTVPTPPSGQDTVGLTVREAAAFTASAGGFATGTGWVVVRCGAGGLG